jgi:transcription elongation factor Elf1
MRQFYMEKLSKASDREDFPYCVYCGEKVSLVVIMDLILTYTCTDCGESVEVRLYEELL